MGATEILFIFFIYLLLFGAKGIPSMAKSLGQAVRSFRNATQDIQREIMSDDRPPRQDFSNVRKSHKSPPNRDQDESPSNMSDGPLDESGPEPSASVQE